MITLIFAILSGLISLIVAVIVGIVTIGSRMSEVGKGDN